jgi:SAM-dependent methyltransferase
LILQNNVGHHIVSRLKDIRGLKYPDPYLIRFFFKKGLHNSPGRVLEAGCGNGCNLQLFREYDWKTTGIDICPRALADAEANFADMESPSNSCFLQHDLTTGLPESLNRQFDCFLFPSSLNYIPCQSMRKVLCDSRRLARSGAAFYLRVRTLADFRYRRGELVEHNGFRLTTDITGERGLINVFYRESELLGMLQEHLGADPAKLMIFQVDYQNLQCNVLVSNSDLVIWGQLPA